MTPQWRIVCEGLRFPESPRWHDGALWFAEKRAGMVRRVGVDGEMSDVVEVPGQPGGLGWASDGSLLVVSMAERRLLRLVDGALDPVVDLGALTVGRCNDMVVDEAGRAYVGHFGYDLLAGQGPAPASLVLVTPDGEARTVADELHFPNGAVVTADGRTLVVAESAANRLTAFSVEADGGLARRRVFADLGETVPDGVCLDASGAVWVADPLHGQVVRVTDGGEVLERIPVGEEGEGAFACTLGGSDGRTLFVCVYTEEASVDPEAPPVGRILASEVDEPAGGSP